MVTVGSVAVAHCEEVEAELVQHVWDKDVGVLVALVLVLGLVAHRGSVGELGNAVEPFA